MLMWSMDKLRFFSNEMKRESRLSIYDGRQQSSERYNKRGGHHRSHRPGPVFKGVTRELERAQNFLGIQGNCSTLLNKSESHFRDAFWNHKQVEQTWCQGRKVNNEQT